MNGLFEVRDGRVTLSVGRCDACGHRFFPPQVYGCEACGAGGGELSVAAVTAVGTLLDVVRVPGGPDGARPGYTLAEIRLEEGVVVRALAAGDVVGGAEVAGAVEEAFGRRVLVFRPVGEPAGEPVGEPAGEPAGEPVGKPAGEGRKR